MSADLGKLLVRLLPGLEVSLRAKVAGVVRIESALAHSYRSKTRCERIGLADFTAQPGFRPLDSISKYP